MVFSYFLMWLRIWKMSIFYIFENGARVEISGNRQLKIFKNLKIYDCNFPNLNLREFSSTHAKNITIWLCKKITSFDLKIYLKLENNFFWRVRSQNVFFFAKRLLSNLIWCLRGVLYSFVCGGIILIFDVRGACLVFFEGHGSVQSPRKYRLRAPMGAQNMTE